jgi:hypothetical protein
VARAELRQKPAAASMTLEWQPSRARIVKRLLGN